jgi:phage-related protein
VQRNETIKLGEATGAFTQMLEGTGMNVEKFNEGLAACTTEAQKQEYMLKITEQALGAAGEKYKEVNGEIIRANQANDAWMQSLSGVGAAIEPIVTDVKMLGASLLADAVPGVQALADAFRGLMNGEDGAADSFATAMSGLVTGLVTKITEALPAMAEVGLSIITTLATSLAQQLPTLLTTGGQIIAQLLSGIATNLPSIAQAALSAIGNMVSGLQSGLPQVLAKGREILLNLATGIKENLPSLVSQALDILMNFAQTIYDNAPTLIQTGFDVLSNLVQGILNSLPVLLSKAPEIISKFANVINDNFPTILAKGVQLIGQIIMGIIQAIPTLIANIPKIITAIVDVWEAFNWVNLGKKAITFLKDGVLKMVGAVKSAGKNILTSITDALKNLPSDLLKLGKSAISDLGGALRNGLSTVKSGAKSIFDGVVNTFKDLPSKLVSVGKDLVKGLWNGISDMTGWVIGKIQGFGSSVLSGIKSFFGIKSPSRVFRDEVGAMLAEGMAVGIEENADAPLDAMAGLSNDVMGEAAALSGMNLGTINGMAVERGLQGRAATAQATAAASSSMAAKLDAILAAIERGQVLTIDKKQLVGGTATDYDNTLGQRRALVARGAL